VREAIERAFGSPGGPPEFEGMPGCETVKATPKRAVCRLQFASRTVYIKRYRVNDYRERIKYLFARPRAQAEWSMALRLREAGIEAVDPLAVGIARHGPVLGDAWFIAKELPGERFDTVVARARAENRSLAPLLRAAVELYERLLTAGFVHPDLHGGNLLVRWGADTPQIGLVDLHSIRATAGQPSRAATLRMRAKLAHSLWLLLEDREFDHALELLAAGDGAEVRQAVAETERIRLRSRSKRCVRVSTSFVRNRRESWTVWRRRSVDLDSLLEIAHAGGVGSGQPHALRLSVDGELRLVDVWRWAPLESVASMRAWKGAQALAVREIPGRIALAHVRRRRFGFPWESILITQHLPGAIRLDQIEPSADEAEELTRAALDTAMRHHHFGLSARPEDLLAVRSAFGWRVVRNSLDSVPPDRPLEAERAALELEAIRAITAR